MTTNFSILVGVLLLRFLFFGTGDPVHEPMVMIDGWDLMNTASEESAFSLTDDSTGVEYEVVLLNDTDGLPEAYTSYVTTPVCDDTLCALMHIRLYWNLLGNYIGFDTVSGLPLTKNDHIEFLDEDYKKLHRLLLDDHSIIKRKEKKDLFDEDIKRVSEVVDAVTGATAKEIKEVVVDGALYSSYTLYHIVHGGLSDSIRSDAERRYSASLQNKLLASDHADYQLFALKKLDKKDFVNHRDRIIELIHWTVPLNRLYLMKKMPETMWQDQEVQEEVSGFFGDLEVNSKSYFLKKLESMDQMSPKAILNLVKQMELMSQNQLKIFMRILNNDNLSDDVVRTLNEKLEDPALIYGYLVKEFLEQ